MCTCYSCYTSTIQNDMRSTAARENYAAAKKGRCPISVIGLDIAVDGQDTPGEEVRWKCVGAAPTVLLSCVYNRHYCLST